MKSRPGRSDHTDTSGRGISEEEVHCITVRLKEVVFQI
jgi:hypothetical protein